MDDVIDGGIYAQGLRDGRKDYEAQSAEIKRLREALEDVEKSIVNGSEHNALPRAETQDLLAYVRYALNPQTQESEVQNGNKCEFRLAWIGKCGKDCNDLFCEKHNHQKCASCGNQATHECPDAGSLVCGYPLCNDCIHTSNGHRRKEASNG